MWSPSTFWKALSMWLMSYLNYVSRLKVLKQPNTNFLGSFWSIVLCILAPHNNCDNFTVPMTKISQNRNTGEIQSNLPFFTVHSYYNFFQRKSEWEWQSDRLSRSKKWNACSVCTKTMCLYGHHSMFVFISSMKTHILVGRIYVEWHALCVCMYSCAVFLPYLLTVICWRMWKGAKNWCEEFSEKAGEELKPSTFMEIHADGNVVTR